MIPVPSAIEGKEAIYGMIEQPFAQEGFVLGGNWDFEEGYFDAALERDEGETIYLRLPVQVMEGQLDEKEARLKFQQPLLVRHVVHTGIADDSMPILSQMGMFEGTFNQFQTPAEKDGEIHRQEERLEKAQAALSKLLPYLQ